MTPKEELIVCPVCEDRMTPGTVEVKGTVLGFLIYGFSMQHLWFRGADDRKSKKVLESRREAASLRCSKCETVVILPQREA